MIVNQRFHKSVLFSKQLSSSQMVNSNSKFPSMIKIQKFKKINICNVDTHFNLLITLQNKFLKIALKLLVHEKQATT